MNTTSPVAEPKPSSTQAPRLLDQVVSNAEQNGHSHETAVSMADWCRRYVLFHGKRHPRELGLMAIGAFLRHVAETEKDPLPRIELARDSLNFLYRQILHIALPELPLPRPPRLLDQVRQVTRVRHYSRRTEDCYVPWATRFICFHKKRHPRDMSAAVMEALDKVGYRDWCTFEYFHPFAHYPEALVYQPNDALDRILGRK